MKKLISVLLIAATLALTCSLSSCGLFDALSGKVPTVYSDPEKYTAGNAEFEGNVDNLNIWWLAGSVTVKTHAEDTVKIEESANRELDDTFSLHWRYFDASEYGMVLNIYYSSSGNHDFDDLSKDITVYLPEQDGMDISLTIDSAAVDIDTSGFDNTLDELSVSTNSGRISAKIDSADSVRISGQNEDDVPTENREFILKADGTVYDLGISSSYAKLDVDAKEIRSGEVMTVFADLSLNAEMTRRLTVYNSDGKINATLLSFEELDIENRDGACELTLSPEASFTLTLAEKNRFNQKMTPSKISVEFEGATQDGTCYTVGSGEKAIEIATCGDIRILPIANEE